MLIQSRVQYSLNFNVHIWKNLGHFCYFSKLLNALDFHKSTRMFLSSNPHNYKSKAKHRRRDSGASSGLGRKQKIKLQNFQVVSTAIANGNRVREDETGSCLHGLRHPGRCLPYCCKFALKGSNVNEFFFLRIILIMKCRQ